MQIKFSEEQIKFLLELQNELKIQDNRSTRNPMYVIMETSRFTTAEGYNEDGYVWLDGDDEIGNDEDLFEHLMEYYPREIIMYLGKCKEMPREVTKTQLQEVFYEFIEQVKEENELGWEIRKWHYQHIDQIATGSCYSFFEKDSFEHIEANKHNLANPKTYACSMFRTPRMEALRELILNLEVENVNS